MLELDDLPPELLEKHKDYVLKKVGVHCRAVATLLRFIDSEKLDSIIHVFPCIVIVITINFGWLV